MVAVAILAAGRGTRMKSDLPKVLHQVGGRSLVERVLESCYLLNPSRKLVVVGYEAQLVQESLHQVDFLEFVEQREQLGTGHAIQQLLPCLKDFTGDLLVLNGDVPLLRPETLENLLKSHQLHHNAATLLTAHLPDPKGYGRVFCDGDNLVRQIVEDRDCNTAQKQNHRINGGIYCFNWPKLAEVLPKLSPNNDQEEYYLTDVVKYLSPVMAVDVKDYFEISGINDRKQLAMANDILQSRIKDYWMAKGVTMIAPDSITIDDTVELQPDVVIEPQSHLRGNTVVGKGSLIGPGTLIENSKVGENVIVLYSVIIDSQVADGCRVGPYTHLRGQAKVGESSRIGNFVEIKKSIIGQKTNVAHLSYLGDAKLGEGVNVGAGTITANYDGVQKHPTIIGNGTKTGANSVLVAPVTLGDNVTVAAGSVVTDNVPDQALVIARERQRIIRDWKMSIKKKN
ncbi:MAG: bifunctional UDP-N-acetylglucosamine diphosphorylase/glucosamine-1-phosphate N-acetyltransferase GlmU [cyanobacterium endosymbiont of Rhopalodia musculus]|uniref:bifunctional UDP-N-acetylglucosamine diphosphorylase/glucosamine-1-phosphate N-acetyltransferase GlmU n=1 Tax=cyanobacterium endosymbiont of Epithemia clementina EcSB TaxID=3034674 RepID=UPI002480DE29|nr:bifunctional UDP-N-acetylglucosamine diphosphorylase/glucosamine-1-phosphate N-acetyltransferase GlmU [cyanobacterium endosymbiont of Epithemia clementina EcSB]WGT67014.1 bifunctional UDP-N-acetylglucosamine diphosphorylase/glucosamine-1-phosphate N-acetyltransferase GlmU [cyanobacterium endosymbiont of Epithemia clementina EcSB]